MASCMYLHMGITTCTIYRYIKELMTKAGLDIRVDAVGNTFGTWTGEDPSLGRIFPSQATLGFIPQLISGDAILKALLYPLYCLQSTCNYFSEAGCCVTMLGSSPLFCICLPGKIMTGSHADSIVHGGVYDGALGVVGAIAAVDGLRKEGFRPKRSIEVVQFTSEEGDRFSEVCFGRLSLQICGRLCRS